MHTTIKILITGIIGAVVILGAMFLTSQEKDMVTIPVEVEEVENTENAYRDNLEQEVSPADVSTNPEPELELKKDRGSSARGVQKANRGSSLLQDDLNNTSNP